MKVTEAPNKKRDSHKLPANECFLQKSNSERMNETTQ